MHAFLGDCECKGSNGRCDSLQVQTIDLYCPGPPRHLEVNITSKVHISLATEQE